MRVDEVLNSILEFAQPSWLQKLSFYNLLIIEIMKDGEPISSFLKPEQIRTLICIGQEGDGRRRLLDECGGNERVADMLEDLREIAKLPTGERPVLRVSPRVDAQNMAKGRGY